jgi:hypothetical protein
MMKGKDVTLPLLGFASGNGYAGKQLIPLVYDELH